MCHKEGICSGFRVANQDVTKRNKITEKRQLTYNPPQSSNVFLMKKQNLE